MLIHDKKHFVWGLTLMAGFLAVLAYMFTPSFGGTNAFHASDDMFNSISKGSTYYIPGIREEAKQFDGQSFDVTIFENGSKVLRPLAAMLLKPAGMSVSDTDGGLRVQGDLGALMTAAINDADIMFKNDGKTIEAQYGIKPRESMFVWWTLLKDVKLHLDKQKKFKPATFIDKKVIKRGVEVGYNYFGIEGRNAGDEWQKITFALIFYVVYTLWFGYSIFFMFEGLGLQMTAGKKKEM
ncbi:hypothetical protein [Pseudodesulfovibrio senegalensis]|jgi:hypothetical protein|uniref:Uncharacterized protein n=1 Tax=Pseudodesulfovibrio senegalensis TaxID=1721087 RepID=A0A6N6N5Z7_9BACT|nr:hypothetical protein [Pseudodesulfovibrio senegalensis]KAB1442899.1 hypothetical protein F8A88_01080 [Pseudodesulfovibrio senegalensis]